MTATPRLCKAIEHVVSRWGPIEDHIRLMTILYLAERAWAKNHHEPHTEATFYRWNNGSFSHEVLHALEWMDGIEVVQYPVAWDGGGIYGYRSGGRTRLKDVQLNSGFIQILDQISESWRNRSLGELLEYVYTSAEFQGKGYGQPLLVFSGDN